MSRVIEHGNAILDSVVEATGATAAVVRDESSPMTWWSSGPVEGVTGAVLDNLLALGKAHLGDRPLKAGARLRLVRLDEAPFGLAFSFSGVYVLLAAFAAPFNRFVVEPHVRQALPLLEQLVPRLPPLDGDRSRGDGAVRRLDPPKKR